MANAIVWLRRDLRLSDNPALQAALDQGYAPICVYIHAPEEEKPWQPGAASLSWLHHALTSLQKSLQKKGSRLIIRSGSSLQQLDSLIKECKAEAVFWGRLYEPALIARDIKIKQSLKDQGIPVETFNASLLAEPWTIKTLGGEPYRVFTPFWKNASQGIDALSPTPAPKNLPVVSNEISSESIESLKLLPILGILAARRRGG
jgi:deoxyribodipyrimidine photo-lyase